MNLVSSDREPWWSKVLRAVSRIEADLWETGGSIKIDLMCKAHHVKYPCNRIKKIFGANCGLRFYVYLMFPHDSQEMIILWMYRDLAVRGPLSPG